MRAVLFFVLLHFALQIVCMPPLEKHLIPRPLQLRKAHSDSSVRAAVHSQGQEGANKFAESKWSQSILLFEQGSIGEAIRELEYLHAHHDLPLLPLHYNRAVMQMALFRATKNANHLRYAEMDFHDAVRACPHFYPSYIGLAEVALAQRAWEKAFRILRNILDVLEVQRHSYTDVLMYDENIYDDVLYVSDICADLGLVTYCMGAAQDSERYYAQAMQELQPLRVVDKTLSVYKEKSKMYRQNQAVHLMNNLVLLSRPRRLIRSYGAKDVGLMRWNSVFDLVILSSGHKKQPSATLSIDVEKELRESRRLREVTRMEREPPPIVTTSTDTPHRSDWRATIKNFMDFDAFKPKREKQKRNKD